MPKIRLRALIKQFHKIIGLVIGIPFSIICLSGAILVFEPQILRLVHHDLFFSGHNENATFIDIENLYDSVKKQLHGNEELGTLHIPNNNENWRIELTSKRKAEIFVNPYTGIVKGSIDHDKGFFFYMRRIHRWMFDLYDRNSDEICWGKMITGCVSLISLPVLITGIIVWWPRKKNNLNLKFKIKTKLGLRRFAYDFHSNGGMYVMIILLVLAATGLTWSFDWYRNAFYRIAGTEYQSSKDKSVTVPNYAAWQKVFESVSQKYPQYRWMEFSPGQVNVSVYKYGDVYKSDIIKFSEKDGTLKQIITYDKTSRQKKTRGWIVALHEGLWCGLFSQIITFIAAIAGTCLPFSAYYLYYKRRNKSNKPKFLK